FVKVRHWGLLANGQRAERLELSRRLLWAEWVALAVGKGLGAEAQPGDKPRCPCCGVGELVAVEILPRPGRGGPPWRGARGEGGGGRAGGGGSGGGGGPGNGGPGGGGNAGGKPPGSQAGKRHLSWWDR